MDCIGLLLGIPYRVPQSPVPEESTLTIRPLSVIAGERQLRSVQMIEYVELNHWTASTRYGLRLLGAEKSRAAIIHEPSRLRLVAEVGDQLDFLL